MDVYTIRRRSGWADEDELAVAAKRSDAESARMGTLRWLRTYHLHEDDGRVGTICVYEADDADTIRAHARAAGIPADEITLVTNPSDVFPDLFPRA